MSMRGLLFAAGAVVVASSFCHAQTTYHINHGSTFKYGCLGPCRCAIFYFEDARGGFTLTPTHSDILYDYYAVTGFVLDAGTEPSWHYTGAGTYQVGGDPALHRIHLDLVLNGDQPVHFDSGFVPVESALPNISLTMNNEADSWCVFAEFALSMSPHCPADFNGDGDAGTDADIEAFFACLGGTCCASCGSADFNNDGDAGTDTDIEAFFRVLAGGTC